MAKSRKEEFDGDLPTAQTQFVEDELPTSPDGEYDDPTKEEASTVDDPAPADDPTESGGDDDIPENLRGKSIKELAKMYTEAHSTIGRQGQELGEWRKRADTLLLHTLKQQQAVAQGQPKPAPKEEVDEVDFFADPKKAVAKAVEEAIAGHPRLAKLSESQQQMLAAEQARRRSANMERFNQLHPDAKEILADEGFRAWVAASPIRKGLMLRAHKQFDVQSADEVFSTWKALHPKADPAAAATRTEKTQQRRSSARVPSGSGAGAGKTGNSGGRVYRRADLIKLMEDDPERYAAMADDITRAYAEGRVK